MQTAAQAIYKAINNAADAEIAFRYLITELVTVYKQELIEISFRP